MEVLSSVKEGTGLESGGSIIYDQNADKPSSEHQTTSVLREKEAVEVLHTNIKTQLNSTEEEVENEYQ